MSKSTSSTADDVESVAILALGFLAGEPRQMARFLELSGIGAENLRAMARDPDFLRGVLDFLVSDESLLLAFTAHAGIDADRVVSAQRRINGGIPQW